MPIWLVVILLIVIVSAFWLCIIVAMLIKFAKTEERNRAFIKKAKILLAEKDKVIKECGFREIVIGGDE